MSASAWFAEGGRIVERRYELDRRVGENKQLVRPAVKTTVAACL
jgi:hypothetical protein